MFVLSRPLQPNCNLTLPRASSSFARDYRRKYEREIHFRHGSSYCWSNEICPTGTACIQGLCCNTGREFSSFPLASALARLANSTLPRICPSNMFQCRDATCGLHCDGRRDCPNGEDEKNCTGMHKSSNSSISSYQYALLTRIHLILLLIAIFLVFFLLFFQSLESLYLHAGVRVEIAKG